MLLCVDIGNSNIVLGCYSGDKLVFISRVATDASRTADQYAVEIDNIFILYGVDKKKLSGSIISSVVPALTDAVGHAVKTVTGLNSLVLTYKTKSGLNILLEDASCIGADFIAAAVGAKSKYPLPVIIVNMGTATTFSAVSKDGDFLGGSICAGLKTASNALLEKTSLLHGFAFEAPEKAIGRGTVEALKSGTVLGGAALIDGMCTRFFDELKEQATVVATGGLAPYVIPCCKTKIIHDDMLLLDGLRIIYEMNE